MDTKDVAADLLASPRRGPVPDPTLKGYKRQLRVVTKLFSLGQRYRKTYTKKQRSQALWVRFLRKFGPEFLGKGKTQ